MSNDEPSEPMQTRDPGLSDQLVGLMSWLVDHALRLGYDINFAFMAPIKDEEEN